ncbi:hypothetical protein SISSUDRAFT_1067919 [Sistotremastrum suecicum HHB10207 ss-3]|uniref:Uncharacterized protein n=1 Tax=Sistotremastrum suecicum HHB10207 ss-3 TaxID=1314776 RepID=A0A165WKA9_9AGAM|nr:hypothetical protein SISSUDRAFT_1067919 [Sistotremastrum suecicum HHB10207 ss-3]
MARSTTPRRRRPTEKAAAASPKKVRGGTSRSTGKEKIQTTLKMKKKLNQTAGKKKKKKTRPEDEPMDVDSDADEDAAEDADDDGERRDDAGLFARSDSSESEEEEEGQNKEDDANLPEMDAHGEIPAMKPPKSDSSKDLHLIFSPLLKVIFTLKDDEGNMLGVQTLKGRWCLICRDLPKFSGSACRGAFKLGGNSSCRQHIRSHYDINAKAYICIQVCGHEV